MNQRWLRLLMVAICAVLAVLSIPATPTRADTGSNWTGSYYSNRDLAGSPVFLRIDPALIFNWGQNSPGPGIGSNNWSARWTTIQYLNAGTYRFTITADDGVRAYIDGQIILDAWHDEAATTYTVNAQVAAGNHAIQIDYYQGVGDASLSVSWDYVASQSTAWLAQYFNNTTLSGSPVLSRYENAINYFWGYGSPDPAVTPDYFSARWTATLPFSAATYRFTLAGDDGVRLFIDNASVIDQWKVQNITAYSIDVPLSAGLHTLRIEYFEATNQAVVRFDYGVAVGPPPYPGTQSNQWYGEYYPNTGLAGSPSFIRLDGQSGINFNWSATSPAPGFPHDNYSVRWTRQVYFPGRPYLFYLTVDDGARLYIDTTLIIDAWKVQSATTYAKEVDLTEGYHVLRLEYFQQYQQAVVNLTWDPPNGQTPTQPPYGVTVPTSPTGVSGTVTFASYLNLRAGPGIIYDVLNVLKRGDAFAVLARNIDSSWVEINSALGVGWVSSYYVTISGNLNAVPVQTVPLPGSSGPIFTGVRGQLLSGLRVRSGPGSAYAIVDQLDWGTVVDIVGRDSTNTWLEVQYGYTTGWIYAPYVRIVSGALFSVPITG